MQLSNHKILITGGATGIGLGLAERFLKEGNTVIICGRRAEALAEATATHPGLLTHPCDLNVEAERIALYDWVASEHPDLSVLVNNAGIQNRMDIADEDFYPRALTEITTNVIAPVHLTTLFTKLPSLKTVMNVTSGLAFVQISGMATYCATKAFMHSFTLSLRHLLRSRSIEVIDIIPPALNTDLGGKGLHDGNPEVGAFIEAIFGQLSAGSQELTFGFSEKMAAASPEEIRAIFQRMNP